MDKTFREIVEKTRELWHQHGVTKFSLADLARRIDVPTEILMQYARDDDDLVEKILQFERDSFKDIFDTHDFEGVNAIDILLTVSKEVARKFMDVTPSVTLALKKHYPDVYHKHIQERINFIFGKIQINLTKGINQGIYRDDLSIELVARLYISRLIDLHDPELFPPQKFSFDTLFNFMFDNFVRSIAKPEGIAYFEMKKKKFNL
jgi:AcrR family transcriptional regulator